jgi:hypothetical protein
MELAEKWGLLACENLFAHGNTSALAGVNGLQLIACHFNLASAEALYKEQQTPPPPEITL